MEEKPKENALDAKDKVVNHFNSCKRKADNMSDDGLKNNSDNVEKKIKIVNEEPESYNKRDCASLLVFSDDILLMIISNLNHRSILSLSKTCTRLQRVCQDHTLWREIHFGDNLVTQNELHTVLNYVSVETKSIYAKGFHKSGGPTMDTLTPEWLADITEKCPNLSSLSLPNHYIECKDINIHHFPRSLTKLDLSGTYLRNAPWNRSYFKYLCVDMPDLEVLILSNCHWFEPHSLMALSKCPKLKELRLDGCVRIKDCVAYCGLAARCGFKSLKTLDLRKCPIGSSELVCFASVTSIVNLYLESPVMDDPSPNIAIDTPIMILFTNEPMIEIRADGNRGKVACPRLKIEKLFVRNYKLMTDASLNQLARDATFLNYLDVSGSGVTANGIERFKSLRPNVTLVTSSL